MLSCFEGAFLSFSETCKQLHLQAPFLAVDELTVSPPYWLNYPMKGGVNLSLHYINNVQEQETKRKKKEKTGGKQRERTLQH